MKMGFEETQAEYVSGSQSARVWTEQWVGRWLYCPNCGHRQVRQFAANRPVADFFCTSCSEEYELKSQKRVFGPRIVDGAFKAMSERLAAQNNPNLLLLNYDRKRLAVTNVVVVPKHFFVPEIIQKRKPLSATARRAGWVGCNILLKEIPESGKIFIVRDGLPEPQDRVLELWRQTLFLREASSESRGWLVETMKCVDSLAAHEFSLDQMYAFESKLQALHPNNHHVKEKLRQQLQVLRDHGYLEFLGRGRYRRRRLEQ